MVSFFRFLVVSLVFTLGMTTAGSAWILDACQNPKIMDYLSSIEVDPRPVSGDINGDGHNDTIMFNLKDKWLVAEFYINDSSLKLCEPDAYLNYLNITGEEEPKWYPAEWFPMIEITSKGSIIFTSQFFCKNFSCANGGASFVDYILTLRYLPKNSLQIIGYDNQLRNIQNGPDLKISINLLTGKISEQVVGDHVSGGRILDKKIIKYKFEKAEIPSGSLIDIGHELSSVLDQIYDNFDRLQYYDDAAGEWKQ